MTANCLPWPLAGLLASVLGAQAAPPPIPVELRSRFGFEGPLVLKIGDGIQGLRIADLDGDGRREAVVLDPRRARLCAVHVEQGDVAMTPILAPGQLAGYALGDVNGDGKDDLLLVDSRGRLLVRQQGQEPANAPPPLDLGLGGRGMQLLAGDLDGDARADLVAVTKGSLRWVTHLDATPRLSPIETLEENAFGFQLADVDGDGALDLAGVVDAEAMNLRLRLGRGDGTFGPWRIHSVEQLRWLVPLPLAAGARGLATIDGPQRRVVVRSYRPDGGRSALEWYALAEGKAARAAPFAVGDLDRDGDDDVVVAQGDRARLLFFEWRDGTFLVRPVPTLAGVTSLALGDVDRDGTLDLVLASPEEDALAWVSGAAGLERFPERIACPDKPVAAAVDPDGGVLVLARTEKRDAHLDRAMPGGQPARIADLGRLPADPARLVVGDFGDAPGREIAFVVPGEGLRVVSPAAGAATPKGEAAGFTKKMDDGALALTEHDGQPALLVVRERFVRRFRIDAAGQIRVLAQDNGPEGLTELTLAAPLEGGGRLYLDQKGGKLVRVDGAGGTTTVDVPSFDFAHLLRFGDAALLVGPRGVLRVPFGGGATLATLAVQEPPTDRTFYWNGQHGDFDHDGRADLAVLDGHLPGVQILAATQQGFERALAVPVFERPPSEHPEPEPRELAAGDLDGDGRCDLVLVCHDRVLVYLQEK